LIQLLFKALHERKGVGSTSGKTSDDQVIVKPPYFFHIALGDGIVHGCLSICANANLAIVHYSNDGGGVNLWHYVAHEFIVWL